MQNMGNILKVWFCMQNIAKVCKHIERVKTLNVTKHRHSVGTNKYAKVHEPLKTTLKRHMN